MADILGANKKVKITPTDNTELADHKAVLVMDAGDIAVRFNSGDSPVTITVEAMTYIPFYVYSIDDTNTTSSHIFILM